MATKGIFLSMMTTERTILGLFAISLIGLAVYNSRALVLPDAVTIPGMIAGLVLSWFVPALHGKTDALPSLIEAVQGLLVGTIIVYGLSIAGKTLFGKQDVVLPAFSEVVLGQTSLVLSDREIPYEQIFYRSSDQLNFHAEKVHVRTIEAGVEVSRSFTNILVILSPTKLSVGKMSFDPSRVTRIEATTERISFPREVVGLGIVKLAGLIGVFLGWHGVVFAFGCGGAALTLSYLLALTIHLGSGQRMDAVTPMCIASIIWMILSSRFLLAGGLAIALGTMVLAGIELWKHTFRT